MSLPKLEVISVSVKAMSPSMLAHRGLMGEQTERVIVGVCFLLMHIDLFLPFPVQRAIHWGCRELCFHP